MDMVMNPHESSAGHLTPLGNINLTAEGFWPWLVKARAELAELKGLTNLLREKESLLQPLLTVDALENCLLDGISLDLQIALENQLFTEPEQSAEAKAVLNLRDALVSKNPSSKESGFDLNKALQLLATTASSTNQLRQPSPLTGKRNGNSQEEMASEPQEIEPLLEDLQQFVLTNHTDIDPLVKALVIHCQLELIQPFRIGSGRISRAVLNQYLVHNGLLRYPMLILSGYIRRNLTNYQRLQREVRSRNAWGPYLKFMLHGVSVQARTAREKTEKLLEYLAELDEQIKKKCSSVHTPELVRTLVTYPAISPLRLSARMDIHYTTATRYLKKLAEEGFVINRQSGKYQLYTNVQLVRLLGAGHEEAQDGFE